MAFCSGTQETKQQISIRINSLAKVSFLIGSPEEAKALIKPLPDGLFDYYPCQPLKTVKRLFRFYLGNVPALLQEKRCKELV